MPAGLVDSGLSSLSTFAIGLFAIHFLTNRQLGAYALFLSAYLLSAVIPAMGVFTPAEVAAVALERPDRPAVLRQSMPIGAPVAVLSALIVCPAALLVPTGVAFSTRVAFAVTAAVLSAVSPVQDHVRRVLHQGGRSWAAALVSSVQLVVVAATLTALWAGGVGRPWVPFTALAVGNAVSLMTGVALARSAGEHRLGLSLARVLRSGVWLLSGSGFRFFAAFASIAIVTARVGAAPAGYAEAARVLAQPVTVLAIGMLSVFSPDIMAAAQRRESARVHRLAMGYIGVAALAALVWIVIVTPNWSVSPLHRLFASAYIVKGLLPLVVIAETSGYAALGYAAAVVGGRRERASAARDVLSGITDITVTTLTTSYGAFALVWGGLAGGAVTYAINAWTLRSMFRTQPVSGVPGRPPDTSHQGFTWRTWHVALVALVALVVGAVIGGATGKTTTKTITASPTPTRTGAVSAAASPTTQSTTAAPTTAAPTTPAPPTSPPTTSPAPLPPTTQRIYTASGDSRINTPNFTVPTADWTVAYAYDCTSSANGTSGTFVVTLYKDLRMDAVLVNELSAGKIDSRTVHDGPGTYYLEINTQCSWTVHVVTAP
jgi:hypothetical protein